MAAFNQWLRNSLLLGWLIRWSGSCGFIRHSLSYKFITRLLQAAAAWLRGSLVFGWAVPGPGSADRPTPYGSSLVARMGEAALRPFLKVLWSLGGKFRSYAGTSLLCRHPLGFLGLMIFFYLAMDIGINEPQGRALALKILLALAGLALTLVRPTADWWRKSLSFRGLRWWNGYQEEDHRPGMECTLFLVVAYVVVDYLVRNIAMLGFLSGLWDELLFLLIAAVWAARTGLQQLKPRGTGFLLPFIIYLCVYLFLFIVNSPEQAPAVEGLRVYLQYVLWFFIGANLVFRESQFKWLCDVFLLLVTLVALYGIYQYIIGVQIPTTWFDSKVETSVKTRVFSIIGSPNILGSLLVLSFPLAVSGFKVNQGAVKKTAYLAAAGIMAACLVFTLSRGAWLAMGLSVLLLGLWLDKRILWALILLAALTSVLMPSVYDRLAYMTTPEYLASSERGGRIGRWTQTMAHWQNAPATGVGLGRFGGAVAARYFPNDSFYADNFYLKTGAEAGWLGLGAFLILVLVGLHLARRSLDNTADTQAYCLGTALLAGLVGVLAHNAVENVFEVPMMATYFWFFLGTIVALGYISKPKRTERYEEA